MRTSLRAVAVAVVLLASARSASAQLVKSCDPTNAVANTANILCVGSSTCTATAVNFNQNVDISIGANFDFTKAQCPFDLGGRTGLRGNPISSSTDPTNKATDGGTVFLNAYAGSIFDSAAINVIGENQGGGGDVEMQAATSITIAQPIDAHGGGGDGGSVD